MPGAGPFRCLLGSLFLSRARPHRADPFSHASAWVFTAHAASCRTELCQPPTAPCTILWLSTPPHPAPAEGLCQEQPPQRSMFLAARSGGLPGTVAAPLRQFPWAAPHPRAPAARSFPELHWH